jgi:hypothetical protein
VMPRLALLWGVDRQLQVRNTRAQSFRGKSAASNVWWRAMTARAGRCRSTPCRAPGGDAGGPTGEVQQAFNVAQNRFKRPPYCAPVAVVASAAAGHQRDVAVGQQAIVQIDCAGPGCGSSRGGLYATA